MCVVVCWLCGLLCRADDGGDSGFLIRKRMKSEHSTPISMPFAAADPDAASRLQTRGANLAQQFADAEME